jgi:hypothetical protein
MRYIISILCLPTYLLLGFTFLRDLGFICNRCHSSLLYASIFSLSARITHSLHLLAISVWAFGLLFYFLASFRKFSLPGSFLNSNHIPQLLQSIHISICYQIRGFIHFSQFLFSSDSPDPMLRFWSILPQNCPLLCI